MDPVSAGLMGVQLAGGLYGMIAGGAARRAAEHAREMRWAELAGDMDAEQYGFRVGSNRDLMSQTGIYGDALESLGRRLGSAAGASGMWNSSAVGGLLAQNKMDANTSLADLAARNYSTWAGIRARNRRELGGLRLSAANEAVGQANAQYGAGVGGFMNVLGDIAKEKPWKT